MLIIVRHGRTEANASGLLLGRRLDPASTSSGGARPPPLAAALPDAGPGRSAARCAARGRRRRPSALPVEIDERWIELDYGDLDGTPLRDVPADVWATWRADLDFGARGGESLARARRAGAGGLRRPGRGGRASATSSSSPTCRRSRRRWPGRSGWATRSRGAPSSRPASITRIATGGPAPVAARLQRRAPTSTGCHDRRPDERIVPMLAVTCVSQDRDDPLRGLEVGERPEPEVPDGWVTVHAAGRRAEPPRPLVAPGVGLAADRLPMVLGCDGAGVLDDGTEVVVHAVIGDPAPVAATRRSTRGARCCPSSTTARWPSGSWCRSGTWCPSPPGSASRRRPASRPPASPPTGC